jgi:cytochrome c oxidase cbb3-type subunit 4
MDINDLRSAVTVVSLTVFLGLVIWAWSRARARDFQEAAMLPFEDELEPTQQGTRTGGRP